MKISKIVAFSLTMASTPALAFQAKDTTGSDLSVARNRRQHHQ